MRVRMTSERLAPALASTSPAMAEQRRTCAATSPTPAVLPSGPIGAVPLTAITLPMRTAREKPITGS